jgi:hypothetical protein
VASDGAFRFAVVWQHEQEIRARRFAYDGVADCFPVGGEIPVSTPGETSLYPRVDMAADGTFVVTWASNAIDADGGVVAREFLANGTPVGQAFAVNTTTLGLQTVPDTAISAGTFAVTWNTPDSGAAPPRNVVVRRYARRVVFSDGFESNDFTAWSDTEF